MKKCHQCGKPVMSNSKFCTNCGFAMKSKGPEKLTLLERLMKMIHIPYAAGCILMALPFLFPLQILARYIDTRDLSQALTVIPPVQAQPWLLATSQISTGLLWFSLFYAPKYMRSKIVEAKRDLLPLLSEGEEAFVRAFGNISNALPPLAIGIVTLVMIAILYSPPAGASSSSVGFYEFFLDLIIIALFVPAIGTFIWLYFSSLMGLSKLGKQHLKLKPFYEDPMLGLRPMGSLSLSVAAGFFAVVALEAINTIAPVILFGSPETLDIGFTVILTVLGASMFFIPLFNIHGVMVRDRRRAHASIRGRFSKCMESAENPTPVSDQGNLTEVRNHLEKLTDAFTVDMAMRQAEIIPTWPFDKFIFGSFSGMVISLTLFLLPRILSRLGI